MKNVLLAVSGLAALAGGLIVQASPRQENPPRVAAPKDSAAAGIGRTLAPLSAKDLRGERTEAPDRQARATVVALTSTTCPLCLRFGPTLAALEKEFAPKGVRFIYVNPSPHEDRAEMKAHLGRLGLKGSYVHDEEQEWVASLGAKTTTEAFVLSAQGRILYRGAVDDQYAIGASLPKPRNRYLADALTAVLAGRSPKVSAVSAPGCIIEPPLQARQAEVTFHNRIQHIVHRSCLSCHRTDGAGPFPLETYGQVRSRAKMIQYVVDQGIMPPWFAKKGVGGPWRNDRSLTDQDKADLKAWFEAGTPRGRDEDAPEPVAFSKGWTIGQPDAVFQLPQPISIPASGVMSYQNVDVPTSFAEDKWLERIEVLPGDRRAVHHVLVFARQPRNGPATAEDIAAEGLEEVNGFFGAYVPGNSGLVYPSGLAKRLPKGSVLRFQLHYTPYGTATTDQTKIGLVFAKKPPTSEVHTASVANFRFAIPPGDPSHEVVGQLRAPMDVKVLSFLPHMHVRGRAARYELQRGGSSTVLLDIPRYDFNW